MRTRRQVAVVPFADLRPLTRAGMSFWLHAGVLDDLGVFLVLGLRESGELLDRHGGNVGSFCDQPLFDVRLSQDLVDLLVQPFDDLGRRAAGREEADP